MPFDFLDGLEFIGDLFSFLGSSSDSEKSDEKDKVKKKSKYRVEWWGGSLLLVSTILLFFVFKEPLPAKDFFDCLFNNRIRYFFCCVFCTVSFRTLLL